MQYPACERFRSPAATFLEVRTASGFGRLGHDDNQVDLFFLMDTQAAKRTNFQVERTKRRGAATGNPAQPGAD